MRGLQGLQLLLLPPGAFSSWPVLPTCGLVETPLTAKGITSVGGVCLLPSGLLSVKKEEWTGGQRALRGGKSHSPTPCPEHSCCPWANPRAHVPCAGIQVLLPCGVMTQWTDGFLAPASVSLQSSVWSECCDFRALDSETQVNGPPPPHHAPLHPLPPPHGARRCTEGPGPGCPGELRCHLSS